MDREEMEKYISAKAHVSDVDAANVLETLVGGINNKMIFKGFKIRVRCVDWEQVNTIGNFWQSIQDFVSYEDVVGLGMNWSDDYLYFDYAIGVIDNDVILEKLKNVPFSQFGFDVNYFEIELPNANEWISFKGKDEDVQEIYENSVDCYNKEYDYELEYLDGKGNIEIKIHFINN